MVRIVDLSEEHLEIYSKCLEEWSPEMKDTGDRKLIWYDRMKDRGLGVKLALDDKGVVGGMIHYVPIEFSPAEGKDLYFVHCIWVHGYKEGRGNFQKKGMGKALLKAAEDDVRSRGSKGLVAWGIMLPFFMRSSFFKKHGYKKVDREGMMELVWKPFDDQAMPPKWIEQKKKPEKGKGKVIVASFVHGWCPGQNMVYERAKRACQEFGDKVTFVSYDTMDRKTFLEWGIMDALYINGKQIRTGPPPSYEKIRKAIGKEVNKSS
jgi:GNAT superfamily N-acetyltransferase